MLSKSQRDIVLRDVADLITRDDAMVGATLARELIQIIRELQATNQILAGQAAVMRVVLDKYADGRTGASLASLTLGRTNPTDIERYVADAIAVADQATTGVGNVSSGLANCYLASRAAVKGGR